MEDIYFNFSNSITPSSNGTEEDLEDNEKTSWRKKRKEASFLAHLSQLTKGDILDEDSLSASSLSGTPRNTSKLPTPKADNSILNSKFNTNNSFNSTEDTPNNNEIVSSTQMNLDVLKSKNELSLLNNTGYAPTQTNSPTSDKNRPLNPIMIELKLPAHTKSSINYENALIDSHWLSKHPWSCELFVEHDWLDHQYIYDIDQTMDGTIIPSGLSDTELTNYTWELWQDDDFFFDKDTGYVSCSSMYAHMKNKLNSKSFIDTNNKIRQVTSPFNQKSIFYSYPPFFANDPEDFFNNFSNKTYMVPFKVRINNDYKLSSSTEQQMPPSLNTDLTPKRKRRKMSEVNISDTQSRIRRFRDCITSGNSNIIGNQSSGDIKKTSIISSSIKGHNTNKNSLNQQNRNSKITEKAKKHFLAFSQDDSKKVNNNDYKLDSYVENETLVKSKINYSNSSQYLYSPKKINSQIKNEKKKHLSLSQMISSKLFLPNFNTFKDLLGASLQNKLIQGYSSPLSPDPEYFEFQARSGHTNFQWEKESNPLGYIPPLCNCENEEYLQLYRKKEYDNSFAPINEETHQYFHTFSPEDSSLKKNLNRNLNEKEFLKVSPKSHYIQKSYSEQFLSSPQSQQSSTSSTTQLTKLPSICHNKGCQGLLFIPYSFIEVPLNHEIDNIIIFCKTVLIPPDTEVYCGNTRHTALIVTFNPEHEYLCWRALELENLSDSCLIYDVDPNSFRPFYKPIVQTNLGTSNQTTSFSTNISSIHGNEIISSSSKHLNQIVSTTTTSFTPPPSSSFRTDNASSNTHSSSTLHLAASSFLNTRKNQSNIDPNKGIPIKSFSYHRRPLKLCLRKKENETIFNSLFTPENSKFNPSRNSALLNLYESISVASSDVTYSDISEIIDDEWKHLENDYLDSINPNEKEKLTQELLDTLDNLLTFPLPHSSNNTLLNSNITISQSSSKSVSSDKISDFLSSQQLEFFDDYLNKQEMEQIAFSNVYNQLYMINEQLKQQNNVKFNIEQKKNIIQQTHKAQTKQKNEIIPQDSKQPLEHLHQSQQQLHHNQFHNLNPQHQLKKSSSQHSLSQTSFVQQNQQSVQQEIDLQSLKNLKELQYQKNSQPYQHNAPFQHSKNQHQPIEINSVDFYKPQASREDSDSLNLIASLNVDSQSNIFSKTMNPLKFSKNKSELIKSPSLSYNNMNYSDKNIKTQIDNDDDDEEQAITISSPEENHQPVKSSLKHPTTIPTKPTGNLSYSSSTTNKISVLNSHLQPQNIKLSSITSERLQQGNKFFVDNTSPNLKVENNTKNVSLKNRSVPLHDLSENEISKKLSLKTDSNSLIKDDSLITQNQHNHFISDSFSFHLENIETFPLTVPSFPQSLISLGDVIRSSFGPERIIYANKQFLNLLCNALDKYFTSLNLKISCLKEHSHLKRNSKEGCFYFALSSKLPIQYDNFQITVEKFRWSFQICPISSLHALSNDNALNKNTNKTQHTINKSTSNTNLSEDIKFVSKFQEISNQSTSTITPNNSIDSSISPSSKNKTTLIPNYTRTNKTASATRKFPGLSIPQDSKAN